MASPAPLDDQTDEDFFDKLVNDDFGITESRSGLTDAVESDEANAFANLSITDAGTVTEDFGNSELSSVPSLEKQEKDILVSEDSVPLVPSTSAATNMVTETGAMAGVPSNQSGGTRVKEVQWSVFSGNSAQTSAGEFGSYSEFFNELADGENLVDPFASAGDNPNADSDGIASIVENPVADSITSDSQAYGMVGEQTADGQNLYSSQYWESVYPGWRYDPSTGEWHQLDGYDAAANAQVGFQDKAQSVGDDVVLDQRSEVSYLQQTAQSVVGTVSEGSMTGSVSDNCNQVSQGSSGYPAHMVFDPQYPGWYYDTIAQEWRLLESYTQVSHTTSTANDYQTKGGNASSGGFVSGNDYSLHNGYGQFEHYQPQGQVGQGQVGNWDASANKYTQSSMWQSEPVADSGSLAHFSGNQQTGNLSGSMGNLNNYTDHQMGFKTNETVLQHGQANHGHERNNGMIWSQSYASADNSCQFNQPKVEQNQQMHFSSPDNYETQKSVNYSQQQPFQTGNGSYTQFSHSPNETRFSAGHPAHALVTFGFGGKLIVMKGSNSSYGSQAVGGSISIFNLMEVVMNNTHSAGIGSGTCDYFHALCQQSFPGPLVGGNTAAINKWTDDRIANCQSPNMDFRKGELLRLLLSLLKISCQHYGKLRSPFGVDSALLETDGPESAVAKLFASAKRNGAQLSQYGAFTHCMQNLPSEGQSRAIAVEVQNLLVSGRRKEALQCAQEGQLWGPALVLAAQLGEKFYVDTVKQMAHHQFISGSPLRTFCLLIAGQPADVFSEDSSMNSRASEAVNISPQPAQFRANGMLDDWEENLAIITANRTKDDELVMIHLGDCLWKERGEVAAAHSCYLVAETNFESYSDSARLCLIGADHMRCPRTFASPDAIQRTELYEYSKVLGNSQFILLPFQPYKLIYAHMLAEVGKVSDSLRYCQAILKTLKNSGRVPEVETWKSLLSSLEERIRTHQQGGYNTNLAPAKLVGKLFTSIDRSIHRMIGAPPQPASSTSQSSNEHDNYLVAPKVVNSQSTMAMSSLLQSASMEPISTWAGDGNRMSIHNRSVSEPDFGRSTKQEASTTDAQGQASIAGGPSRFGRFGSQILQKTMGWVAGSRSDRQAKLGEKNKFYYDEKLKRWVEEGAEPPAEEAALPPPPTIASFQNGMLDYNQNNAFKSQNLPVTFAANGVPEVKSPDSVEYSSGIPPIPPSTNQFSARGRMGVRSRYVDTFNKGGDTPANLFQTPSIPAAKPVAAANFFVPAPAASVNPMVAATRENTQEAVANEHPSTSVVKESSFPSLSSSSLSMQHSPSMDNIAPYGNKGMGGSQNLNPPLSSRTRAASWSGSYDDPINAKTNEIRSLGEVLGMPPSSFMPSDPSSMHLISGPPPMNGGSYGDLHEVEL
ncbi:protein transport protein SEC16A homolog [Magnolia sinica]|uniref:protein transport protein SEC16A homolog n=1 Tax=Magnolia sinica TaxID=86752 RepID=UPI0026598700|nr:protein transport protein SEC16A homolog [Magnolia sinica]XP_058086810.1 protein transport protein SEC16A homolog [Magnolia sinica]